MNMPKTIELYTLNGWIRVCELSLNEVVFNWAEGPVNSLQMALMRCKSEMLEEKKIVL